MMSDEYLGQMESTLLISFLKVSKIKWSLADPQNPSIIRDIKSLFDKVYSPGDLDKNSQMIEIMDGDNVDTTLLVASSAMTSSPWQIKHALACQIQTPQSCLCCLKNT